MPNAAERLHMCASKPAPPISRMELLRALAPRSKRGLAGAALVAMMIGIVVNAVALQHGRRVELAPDAAAPVRPAPLAAVKPPVAAPAPLPASAPTPPRPAPAPTATAALAHTAKADDPIAGLLRPPAPDKRKLTASAQNALAKLGYSVKPTGALDAETKSALADFQKKHKLPVTAEITPKLVKTLNAADE